MSTRYRYLFRRLLQTSRNYKPSIRQITNFAESKSAVTCSLGFSLFTWLGFNQKLTAEDELIHTIKHCVLFSQRGEYEKAEQLLHVALKQAQQMQNQLGITYIYDVMANLALERGQLDKAKKLFVAVTQRIMAEGAKENDPRVIHLSVKLARISHLQNEYSTAKLGYEWCLNNLNNLPQGSFEETDKLIAMTEDWYGRLLIDYEQNDHGLDLMINALSRMEKTDIEKEHIIVQMNDIGTVCDRLGKYDEAITYFLNAIKLGKNSSSTDELGTVYVNLGRIYLKKNLLEKARKSCGQGWKIGVSTNNNEVKNEAELCFKEIKNLS